MTAWFMGGPLVAAAVMRPATAAAVLVLGLAAMAALLPAASAAWGMPDALTERGQTVEGLYSMVLGFGILVFLIVFVWLVILVVRFRDGTGHGRATHEKHRHSTKAEVAWFGVPLIMVLFIGYSAYAGLVKLDHQIAPEDAGVTIQITASQWNWLADYGSGVQVFANPDATTGNVSATNSFVVPQDTPIAFYVTSADVIHAFQVLDANRAYVMFVDANPTGENAHNVQTASLPAGHYFVQCNKMCLNPGHAYMHASIDAVPKATYDHWLAQKKAEVLPAGEILQTLKLKSTASGLVNADGSALAPMTLAAKTHVVVDLIDTSAAVTLKVEGLAEKTIPANTKADTFFAFDLAQPGDYTLTGSNGGTLKLSAVPAIAATVTLDNFKLTPDATQYEVGKTYLIQVPNVGTATHDLFIGHYHGGSGDEVLAHSDAVAGAGSKSFLFKPTQASTLDIWCSQPGHHGLGMYGTLTIH